MPYCSADTRGRDGQFASVKIIAIALLHLCLAWSSPRRIGRTASRIEDNIETRCSNVYGRSPASTKAGDQLKAKRAMVRSQVRANRI